MKGAGGKTGLSRRLRVAIAVGFALPMFGAVAVAGFVSPGTLDNGFGDGQGWNDTSFDGDQSEDRGRDVVSVSAAGKLIVVGESTPGDPAGADADFALASYEPEGDRDTDFGTSGLATTDFRGGDDRAFAAALTADGKLVVAGSAQTSPTNTRLRFAVARYRLNGKLDPSFGDDGLATTKIAADSIHDFGRDVVVGPSGKITVAGITVPGSGGDMFALARFLPDGRLDRSFGDKGRVRTAFPGGGSAGAFAIARAGRKVVVGGRALQANFDYAVARYRRDGTLDPSFDEDGRVTTDIAGAFDEVADVLVQPNGRVVAAGYSGVNLQFDHSIARYEESGAPDDSFSNDGKETESFNSGQQEGITGLALDADGKILAAAKESGDFALMRFLPGGGLDPDFSPDAPAGIVVTDLGTASQPEAVALQPFSRPPRRRARGDNLVFRGVVAGWVDQTSFGDGFDFALARYYIAPG